MPQPDIVPDKIKSPFDYRILLGISILVISVHIFINYFTIPDNADTIASIFSFLNPLIVSIIGFFIAIRYKRSLIFGKSYMALAIAYLGIFLGEVTYMIYDIIYNIEPYPSIVDIFFFIQYPLLLTHLVLNIKFFTPKINKIAKIWVIVMPITILIGYSIFYITEDGRGFLEFDFIYGVIFVYFSALTLSLAVIGAIIFKEGAIGKAWILLTIGILFNTIGDTWYYNLELFEAYDLLHPVNMFWYAGYWLVMYALIKHNKIL